MQVSSWLSPRRLVLMPALWLCPLTSFSLSSLGAQTQAPESVALTPQLIVSRIASESVVVRELRLAISAAEVGREAARAGLDTILSGQTSQQWNRAESVGAPAADSDWTLQASGQVVQNLATGTQLTYQYQMLHNEADVPSAFRFFRSERSHLQSFGVGVTHELWRNRQGAIFEQQSAAADRAVRAAQLSLEDSLETYSSQALELYWQAVALSNSIDELKASDKRLSELLSYSRERAAFGINEVGDSDRIRADREAIRQRMLATRSSLEQLIARVASLLKLPPPPLETVILKLPQDLGDRPRLQAGGSEPDKIQIIREQLAAAELETKIAEEQIDPRLAAFARAATTGVDPDFGDSLGEMGSLQKPTITLGVQFEMALDNHGARAQLANKRIRQEQLKLQLERVEDELRSLDFTLLREAQAAWDLASSAGQIVQLRAKVARDLRDAYRQGRLGLDQVILATNQQLLAEIDRTERVAAYLRARDRLLAHRGELIESYVVQKSVSPTQP